MPQSSTEEEQQLTIRKLQLEVEDLERKTGQRNLGVLGHIGTILLPYAALIFTVYQFGDGLERQAKAQEDATNRAFMSPILERQANYYFAAVTAAAQFVSSSDGRIKRQAADRFLELYWGPIVMLESPSIVNGMNTMKFCIERESLCSDAERQMLTLYLGSALQKDYFNSWRLTPSAFSGRTNDYQEELNSTANKVLERIETEGEKPIFSSMPSRPNK